MDHELQEGEELDASRKLVISRERGDIVLSATTKGRLTIRVEGDEHGHILSPDEVDQLVNIVDVHLSND